MTNSNKILRVTLTNFKQFKSLDIYPNGKIVYLYGKNGSGKSTIGQAVLDAIQRNTFTSVPITKGETKGEIEIIVGPVDDPVYKIRQAFTEANNTGTISVLDLKSNLKQKAPVEFLAKEILGNVNFSVEDFLRSNTKEMANEIKKIAGLDFTKIDAEIKEDGANKSYHSKRAAELKMIIQTYKITDDVIPHYESLKEIDLSQFSTQLATATANNESVEKAKELVYKYTGYINDAAKFLDQTNESRDRNNSALKIASEEILEHYEKFPKEKIIDLIPLDNSWAAQMVVLLNSYKHLSDTVTAQNELVTKHETVKSQNVSLLADAKALSEKEPESVEQISIAYTEARDNNLKIQKFAEFKEKKAELDKAMERVDFYSKEQATKKQIKVDDLANANIPIEGLSISDDGELMLNDLPFDFKSQSKAEMYIAAIKIYLSMKPVFPIIYMDASPLDSENMEKVHNFMIANDLQGFIEKPTDTALEIKYEFQ